MFRKGSSMLCGWIGAAFLLCAVTGTVPAQAAAPDNYLVEAAMREGHVIVYNVLSPKAVQPLIRDFMTLYPGIAVNHDDDSKSNDMYARFRRERAASSALNAPYSLKRG